MQIKRRKGTVEEQLQLEEEKTEEGVRKASRELSKAVENGTFSETLYGRLLMQLSYKEVVRKVQEYLVADLKTSQEKKVQSLLRLISEDAEVVAFIVLKNCISSAIQFQSLTTTSSTIVGELKDIFLLNKLTTDNPKLHSYLGSRFRRASKRHKKSLIKRNIEGLYKLGSEGDGKALMVRLGTRLIQLVELSGSNIIEVRKVLKAGTPHTKNVLSLTDEVSDIMTNLDFSETPIAVVNKLPMVAPPKNWTNNYDGGFYKGNNFLFTVKSNDVRKHLKNNRYKDVYRIVNKVQQTGWRVNTQVLEVVQHIFSNNMIDPTTPKEAPMLYGGLPTRDRLTWKDFINEKDYGDWGAFKRAKEDIEIRQAAENSKRLNIVYALAIAERMKEYSELYFPYMLDYRGRVYSDVSFLTPQGQHYIKAMLEFSDGKKLDETGVYWLKIHTANVYGKDKEAYEERLRWFEDNEDIIINIGLNPIDNLKEWALTSDSPFEFVAACVAWTEHKAGALVHLPIQLDATCSGLQMYSGLLRDKDGASSVNVIGDNRNDVYQVVADKVTDKLVNGNYPKVLEYTDKEGVHHTQSTTVEATSLIGNVTRSLVKRNVMTVPYGVTTRGMSNQIWDMMDEATLKGKEFWKGSKWIVNKLITTLNQEAIYETVSGAQQGQEYLVSLSRLLDKPASWVSVLYNFPVRQTSLVLKEKRVKTVYGSLLLSVEEPKLNKRRQANSIAPNFIHNIDSTVLLYCVDNMKEQIGCIHDCFLVHPNEGDKIQQKYKEGFIAVMEADPLRNIQNQIDPEESIPFPTFGKLDLKEVRDSKYIIS